MAKQGEDTKTMVDCLIAGGGYVGLSTAVAIKDAAPHLNVMLVDAAPKNAISTDERASAIASAASRMLACLEIWQHLRDDAQPIRDMIVTDSRTSDPVRPVFLTFGSRTESAENQPFAHMVPNKSLVTALREQADKLGIEMLHGVLVHNFTTHDHHTTVELSDGTQIRTRLLIAADGVRSSLRKLAGIKTIHWDYDQMGIVTTVAHEKDHEGRAEEHFLPGGPFATLPLPPNRKGQHRSSLVWTEPTENAQRLIKADPFEFELELERRFGHKLGEIELAGSVKAFPLGLTLAREFVKPRLALVGDAAHGIHPIAGQGLNLGFKDAAALAQVVVETDRLGLDIGSITALERYQQWRRFDTVQMGVVTDVLNRLFSNDSTVLRLARTFGLSAVDRMPSLKNRFIAQAAGQSPSNPALLNGQPI